MALKNFIKENLTLVAAVALPLVLVIGFMLASALPRALTAPPAYTAVFALDNTRYNSPQQQSSELFVRDGRLFARIIPRPAGEQNNYYNARSQRLYTYDAATDTLRPVSYNLPQVEAQREVELASAGLGRIDTTNRAPDGYVFDNEGYYNGGIVTDVFVGGRNGRSARIRKGGASYKIPNIDGNRYMSNLQFLGWIVEEKK